MGSWSPGRPPCRSASWSTNRSHSWEVPRLSDSRRPGSIAIVAFDYDVAVIGSGFGGGVTALRLTEKGYRVGVFEAGRRWSDATLPSTSWQANRFLWMPRLGLLGIQRLSFLRNVMMLSGAGVGGGSLVWANVAYEPHDAAFRDPQWDGITDWKAELGPFFDQARRMLGVATNPKATPADDVMQRIAAHFGVEDTFQPTPVAVYFREPGVEDPDPYFGGEGPTRTGCTFCGGCMIGCRHNAKNRIDRTYLYLAERHGARVHPEHEIVDIERLSGGGFRLTARHPTRRSRQNRYTAEQVVFSAGALGTTKLLLRLRHRLPRLSPRLGRQFRTNSEALVGSTARSDDVDYSYGVAITSSIHIDHHTHIEPVRYPKGSSAMGLLSTIMVDGGGRVPRWLLFLGAAAAHPVRLLRSLSVYRWAERSVILLVMQSLDNALSLRLDRRGRLTAAQDSGKPAPTFIPEANEAARVAAEYMGGFPGSSINEVLFDAPLSAHPLGGACIGADPDHGVVDGYHRIFGYEGLHVVDGAAVTANLGVNPSLTITAMAERAMAMWPNKGEPDRRPPPGSRYVPVDPIPPIRPVVPANAPAALFYH